MSDVVVRLPIRDEAEEQAFTRYLSGFVSSLVDDAMRLASVLDAPLLMVRSEPQMSGDLRVLTFQQPAVARLFASGWSLARPAVAAA